MAATLVDYSSSEDSAGDTHPRESSRKKRRWSQDASLPPLPASFLDQYSSSVRSSTQDDPSLHGGRKRAHPHVEGQWPTHVYLEWHPATGGANLIASIVNHVQQTNKHDELDSKLVQTNSTEVHSLLKNDLDVSLPLHVSLSRPLALQTQQKDLFLTQLRDSIDGAGVRSFIVRPKECTWHPNESETRWFLVLRLQSTPELRLLLDLSNGLARSLGQPLLYVAETKDQSATDSKVVASDESFHVSIGWSLTPPAAASLSDTSEAGSEAKRKQMLQLLARIKQLSIAFSEVKVRIGQDVQSIPLKAKR